MSVSCCVFLMQLVVGFQQAVVHFESVQVMAKYGGRIRESQIIAHQVTKGNVYSSNGWVWQVAKLVWPFSSVLQ